MTDLNKFARTITLKEGKKKSLSIGQVKEVFRLVCMEFAGMSLLEVAQIIRRYSK